MFFGGDRPFTVACVWGEWLELAQLEPLFQQTQAAGVSQGDGHSIERLENAQFMAQNFRAVASRTAVHLAENGQRHEELFLQNGGRVDAMG